MKKETHYTAPAARAVCFNPGDRYLQDPFLEGSREGEGDAGGYAGDFEIDTDW